MPNELGSAFTIHTLCTGKYQCNIQAFNETQHAMDISFLSPRPECINSIIFLYLIISVIFHFEN